MPQVPNVASWSVLPRSVVSALPPSGSVAADHDFGSALAASQAGMAGSDPPPSIAPVPSSPSVRSGAPSDRSSPSAAVARQKTAEPADRSADAVSAADPGSATSAAGSPAAGAAAADRGSQPRGKGQDDRGAADPDVGDSQAAPAVMLSTGAAAVSPQGAKGTAVSLNGAATGLTTAATGTVEKAKGGNDPANDGNLLALLALLPGVPAGVAPPGGNTLPSSPSGYPGSVGGGSGPIVGGPFVLPFGALPAVGAGTAALAPPGSGGLSGATLLAVGIHATSNGGLLQREVALPDVGSVAAATDPAALAMVGGVTSLAVPKDPGAIMTALPTMPGGMGTVELPQPFHGKGWDMAFTSGVSWQVHEQIQEVQMKLNPPELGPVDVKLHVQDNQAQISFVAHNADVRTAIENALPQLHDLFASSGLNLTDANVSSQSSQGHQRAPDNGSGGVAHSDEEPLPLRPVRVAQGLIDAYA